MENRNYKLNTAPSLALPVRDADALLSAADGDAALLYVYLLRGEGRFDEDEAAAKLHLSRSALRGAWDKLAGLGLLAEAERREPRPQPARELPEYTSEDLARRSESDAGFKAVLTETQRLFGRMLSTADMKTLFGIYDSLGLGADVMLLLINHCVERTRAKSGQGRLPGMRAIEREAYHWADMELLTPEQAENYLSALEKREERTAEIKSLLQIKGRELTATERKYIEGWDELGFPPEAIAIAYDRTVVNTGALNWKYMSSILRSWSEKGLHSPAEIEAGDRPTRPARPKPQTGEGYTAPQKSELERMKKLRDKIRNG